MEANKTKLEALLLQIQQQCSTGNRKELASSLRQLMNNRQDYYQESISLSMQDDFSDALFKILLLELDEEEEESIEIAEMSYVGIGSVLYTPVSTAEHYQRRLLLLHYFSDYFTDAIIEIFLKKYRKDNMLEARKLALECLEKMQLADIFWLEENYPHFIDKNTQLAEACNSIEMDPNLTEEEKKEAALLHKVLYAYLKAKYKN